MSSGDVNRTWLASVLFIDVVGFSKTVVDRQMILKQALNQAIERSLDPVMSSSRVILDTGDGAIICFLEDPEHALQSAIQIAHLLKSPTELVASVVVRMGINLGPIKLVRDLNGQLNAVGDGINVGERIMSFAGEGEIKVSRSFAEVVSSLTSEYEQMLVFEGVRADKHSREHIVYRVRTEAQRVEDLQAVPKGPDWSEAVLERYRKALAEHLGPIAALLLKRAVSRATSYLELLDLLQDELSDEKDRVTFRQSLLHLAEEGDRKLQQRSGDLVEPAPLDAKILLEAEKALATFIGPVAKYLVKQAVNTVSTPEDLYRFLGEHIADDRDRLSFLGKR